MGDRPTKLELLEAVRRFLDEELSPELEGVHRFHARVASNALAIVSREIELERPHLRSQFERLLTLVGRTGEPPDDLAALDAAVDAMEGELCRQIREGIADDPAFRERVLEHVRATTTERLAVANPRYR
jgi:AcrR family transcriptional regulator